MYCLITEIAFKLLKSDQINIFLSKILCRLMALLSSYNASSRPPVQYDSTRAVTYRTRVVTFAGKRWLSA